MPVTPTSAESVIANAVKNLIASSATFIAATGAADFTAAKSSIYIVEKLPDTPTEYNRPFALVGLPGFDQTVRKPGFSSGRVQVQLEIDIPENLTPDEEIWIGTNFFGSVKTDIMKLGNPIKGVINDASLRFDRLSQVEEMKRSRDTNVAKSGTNGFWQTKWHIHLL